MSEGPMQPDETAFPETQETLGLLASAALPADARARHLHAIRMRAAELGPAPTPASQEARPLSPQPLQEGLNSLRWRGRRAAAVAGVWLGSLSLGTGVAAAASMNDLPGEPLYGLKRAVEAVQLRLPGDTQDDVRRRLELAAKRLAEAETLNARGADAELLAATLSDAQQLIDEAGALAEGDAMLTSTVAGSASQARVRLTELLSGGLPGQAADRAREAIEAATERADQREADRADEADGRGRGRGGEDRAAAPVTTAPSEDDDDDDDSGRGRGRGRGGEQATSGASGAPDRGGAPPSEADDDDDGESSSGRGQSSHGSGGGDDSSGDDDRDDDDDDDGPGSSSQGQSASGGQGGGQGESSGQGQNSGSGSSGSGNSGGGSSGRGGDDD